MLSRATRAFSFEEFVLLSIFISKFTDKVLSIRRKEKFAKVSLANITQNARKNNGMSFEYDKEFSIFYFFLSRFHLCGVQNGYESF